MKTAVILLLHGSKTSGPDKSIKRLVAEVKKLGGFEITRHAFLQFSAPAAQDALESCIKQKTERIVIVPLFIQSGVHTSRDIPKLVKKAKKQYPGVEIVLTDHVGAHPLMANIVADLVKKKRYIPKGYAQEKKALR